MNHALFFANGNTAFFDESGQVPELQRSWLKMYIAFLQEHGIDPTKVDYTLPNSSHAVVFPTSDGDFNWQI